MNRSTHILNAASNLLGIALVIITGLHVTRIARETFADEVAWGAAICLSLSCLLSYAALRAEPRRTRFEDVADIVFMLGLLCLIASVVVLALWKGH
ncbi:MAG: hypothetical protein ACM3YM_09785 [Sphingomonadales bacterium]